MNTIMIAEDDKDIVDILSLYLETDENKVLAANDGKEAIEVFDNNHIDIALIDIMMPQIDGYTLIRHIRAKSNIPIIVVSAKNMDEDKILGLNLGADDYIEKPFKPLEVVARVNAQLRRFNKLGSNLNRADEYILRVGELELNTQEIELYKGNAKIELTSVEYKILYLLMKNPNRVYTKEQIYSKILGDYFTTDDNTLMVHISRLRAKIEDDKKHPKYIKTIRGLGYKVEKQ